MRICLPRVQWIVWFIGTVDGGVSSGHWTDISRLDNWNLTGGTMLTTDRMHGEELKKEAIALAGNSYAHCYFNHLISWQIVYAQSVPSSVKSLKTNNWTTVLLAYNLWKYIVLRHNYSNVATPRAPVVVPCAKSAFGIFGMGIIFLGAGICFVDLGRLYCVSS